MNNTKRADRFNCFFYSCSSVIILLDYPHVFTDDFSVVSIVSYHDMPERRKKKEEPRSYRVDII
jgi:hypothetical protein